MAIQLTAGACLTVCLKAGRLLCTDPPGARKGGAEFTCAAQSPGSPGASLSCGSAYCRQAAFPRDAKQAN